MSITRAGFAPPDPDLFARLELRMLEAPGTRSFMAVVDDEPAAAGSCEVAPPCAALFGLTTLDRFRRRGCQRALMIARLRAAQEAGCRYASIHSRPDVATGRNALRLGFHVAFTKCIVARPGPGLLPSP
jgi:GNAT superfamily N-acetyltransferase